MAKVFISYSRKDIEFAKRLTGELQKSELDFWIDWEGIPPTVDWWKEIEKGIEEADVFLFLISPDSAKSKICGQEIDTAVKNGKRIIPIVVREIDWQDTPPQLGHLNYIFFSRDDNFDTAVQKLLTAIHTDYEWAATHRRLQVKALEWERNKEENSFLLRGKDLQEAELQLATNSSKDPRPTNLQREYIFESRKIADRQRRNVLIISIATSVILALLAIFAIYQLNTSRGERLGFQSRVAFFEGDYNTATLYAYQSNKIHENESAKLVLQQIPYQNFAFGNTLTENDRQILQHGAWSADERLASYDTFDNDIIIWSYSSNKIVQTLKGHTDSINSVAWSSNGRLASGSKDDTIIIWDLSNGKPLQVLKSHTDDVLGVAWSSDGRLASISADNTIIIWDIASGKPAKILVTQAGQVNSLAWSKDGQLASSTSDQTVIIWNLTLEKPAQVLKGHLGGIGPLAWSNDGQLASGSSDNTVIVWDLSTGQPAETLKGHSDYVYSLAWSPDGRLASGSGDGTVIIWNLATGRPLQILSGQPNSTSSAVSSITWLDDGRLVSTSIGGSIIDWKTDIAQPALTLRGHTNTVSSVAWSTDGKLASGSLDGTVILWNLQSQQVAITLTGHTGPVNSVAWSPDGRLASGSDDKTVIIWDLATKQPAQILKGHLESVSSVAWSDDGKLASSSIKGDLIVWDLTTGLPAQILNDNPDYINALAGGYVGSVTSIAWRSNGQLTSGSMNGTVAFWNLDNPYSPGILQRDSIGLNSIAWSYDGKLASATSLSSISVWYIPRGQPGLTLSIFGVGSLAWSPTGRLAASSSEGITIWDLPNEQPAQIIKGHSGFVSSIAWANNGQLASGGYDNLVRVARSELIGVDPCQWIMRNMTEDEWVNTQGIFFVYKPACPNLPSYPVNPLLTLKGRVSTIILASIFIMTCWYLWKTSRRFIIKHNLQRHVKNLIGYILAILFALPLIFQQYLYIYIYIALIGVVFRAYKYNHKSFLG